MINSSLIYIHIPKTAGRSILSALGEKFHCEHKTIADYCKDIGEEVVRSRFKFTTVRNSWDRAVSWWSFFGSMGPIKEKFGPWLLKVSKRRTGNLNRKFPLDQMSFCRTPGGEVLMDTFIRFEHLDTDWPPVAKRLGVSEKLPTVGKQDRQQRIQMREAMLRSKRPELAPMIPTENYQDMYTSQELIDIVARLDAETIQRFGYTFP